MKLSQLREEIVDREGIRHCLFQYSRGMDRRDWELVLNVFWPDAIEEHMGFSGSPKEFVNHCRPELENMRQTAHMLGNILISLNGSHADVETYFHAYHVLNREGHEPVDFAVGGRYLDQFERRDDEWRIRKRILVVDWLREYEDSANWQLGPMGVETRYGAAKPEDPSYDLAGLKG